MEAWTCGCEMFGCFGGRTEVEYLQFGVDRIGRLDVHSEIWLILLLAILVEKDLGDLSCHFRGLWGLSILFPTINVFKSGLFAFTVRTESIEDGVQPTVQGGNTCLWFESVSTLCYCLFQTVFAESCRCLPSAELCYRVFQPHVLSPAIAYHLPSRCAIGLLTLSAKSCCCLPSTTMLCYPFNLVF